MARFDQYIGLNKKAVDFIDFLKRNSNIEIREFILVQQSETLCGESLIGNCVTVFINDNVNEKYIFSEETQKVVWSSGPMYFTHLNGYMKKISGQMLDMGLCFSWIESPMGSFDQLYFDMEYDRITGEIYI